MVVKCVCVCVCVCVSAAAGSDTQKKMMSSKLLWQRKNSAAPPWSNDEDPRLSVNPMNPFDWHRSFVRIWGRPRTLEYNCGR
jgi:hypothetical protein